jgi:hypothetical protein
MGRDQSIAGATLGPVDGALTSSPDAVLEMLHRFVIREYEVAS